MNKICTSIEQSKKLMELGIDVKTADMYWWYNGQRYYAETIEHNDFQKSDIPAWSLTALLNTIERTALFKTPQGWMCQTYIKEKVINLDNYCDNSIDAVFEMICWLKENNKI